jgi:hypothetical protein
MQPDVLKARHCSEASPDLGRTHVLTRLKGRPVASKYPENVAWRSRRFANRLIFCKNSHIGYACANSDFPPRERRDH